MKNKSNLDKEILEPACPPWVPFGLLRCFFVSDRNTRYRQQANSLSFGHQDAVCGFTLRTEQDVQLDTVRNFYVRFANCALAKAVCPGCFINHDSQVLSSAEEFPHAVLSSLSSTAITAPTFSTPPLLPVFVLSSFALPFSILWSSLYTRW